MATGSAPRVGLLALPSTRDEVLVARELDRLARALTSAGVEPIVVGELDELDTAADRARRAGEDLDAWFVHAPEWADEHLLLRFVEARLLPTIACAQVERAEGDGRRMLAPLSGLFATVSNLKRAGVPCTWLEDDLVGDGSVARVRAWCAAARAARVVTASRVVSIGDACPGMLGTEGGPEVLEQLGVETTSLPLAAIFDRVDGQGDPDDDAVARLVGSAPREEGLRDEDVAASARLLVALEGLVEAERADAITVRCWPEIRERLRAAPCAALARLSAAGVVAVCENDARAAVPMLMLEALAQSPPFLADVAAMSIAEGALELWHCGSASPALAQSPASVSLGRQTFDPVGCTLNFPVGPGAATVVALRRPDANGRLAMLICAGEAIPAPPGSGNRMAFQPRPSLRAFADAALTGGFEHHVVAVHGDVVEEARLACGFLGIDPLVLGQTTNDDQRGR